ncbi:MAG: arginine--tRNA ligase, partial [Patescibacteria group bacterium]
DHQIQGVPRRRVEKRGGAVWLGDRVLVKSDGEPTYLLADLAYHRNKLIERNFDKAVTIVGADHHAEISYVRESVIKFFGIDSSRLHIIVMQLVRLIRGGKEVRMGKRTGEFITLDELIGEVGLDAARYFFLERSPDTHMDFDLDLAKERSVKNPVYYVQYAHARMCSVFEKAGYSPSADSLDLLKSPDEFSFIKKLIQFPEVVEDIAKDYHVHRLPRYAYELARAFHNFYERERIIGEDKNLMGARLALVGASQIVLRNTLNLMGISAPEKM